MDCYGDDDATTISNSNNEEEWAGERTRWWRMILFVIGIISFQNGDSRSFDLSIYCCLLFERDDYLFGYWLFVVMRWRRGVQMLLWLCCALLGRVSIWSDVEFCGAAAVTAVGEVIFIGLTLMVLLLVGGWGGWVLLLGMMLIVMVVLIVAPGWCWLHCCWDIISMHHARHDPLDCLTGLSHFSLHASPDHLGCQLQCSYLWNEVILKVRGRELELNDMM